MIFRHPQLGYLMMSGKYIVSTVLLAFSLGV
jgi:hypothetical protein